jgi:hypothetical protein
MRELSGHKQPNLDPIRQDATFKPGNINRPQLMTDMEWCFGQRIDLAKVNRQHLTPSPADAGGASRDTESQPDFFWHLPHYNAR